MKLQCIHERKRQSLHLRESAKSILRIVSLHSKHQWLQDVFKFFNAFFRMIDYHGESRAENNVNILIKHHDIFRSDLDVTTRIIVIITSHTWNKRHNPQGRTEFKKKHFNTAWSHNLQKCFDNDFIDEAHVIKNISVEITMTLLWLEIVFWILITGTVLANDVKDFKEFMKLLQHKKAKEWWKDDHLESLDVNAINNNSYTLFDDHSKAKLRLTDEVVETFILESFFDVVEKDRLLAKVYQQILLRRTHVFKVSFNSFIIIEENLLKVQSAIIECQSIDKEYVAYKTKADVLLKTLILSNNDQKKPRWSIAVKRKLNMIIVWLDLLTLKDLDLNLKTTSLKKWLFKPDFVIDWMKTLHSEASIFQFARQNILTRLCDDDFKLRALLMKLRSKICLSIFLWKFFLYI